jgi:hypothetical protein
MGKQQRRKRRRKVSVELRNEGFRGIGRFLLESSQLVVCISIGLFGPRTRDLALEEIV